MHKRVEYVIGLVALAVLVFGAFALPALSTATSAPTATSTAPPSTSAAPPTTTTTTTTVTITITSTSKPPPAPTNKDQCKHGGWKNFPQFKNQGDCVSFVATGGRNPAG